MAHSKSRWLSLGLTACVIVGLAILLVVLNRPQNIGKTVVGIIEPMQHIAISDIERGIRDGLAQRQAEFVVLAENANGDKTAIPQIIQRLRDRGAAIYVPVFTATAQATQGSIADKPIVFAAVTDPVAAGIAKALEHPGGNVTGVSDLWPIGSQLDLVREIMPAAKTMGVVLDPGDPSCAATMPLLERESAVRGLRLETRPVHALSEVPQALSSLHGKIDLLFTANDVTVTAAFPALVSFAIENKIPLFAGDYSSVERGAIASIGQNYYGVGLETAKKVLAIKDGKHVSELPISFTTGGDVYVNAEAARRMGVDIPQPVLAKAKEVYKQINVEEHR